MKAVVLSSGGIDSTTCMAMAVDRYGAENVAALSVVYGQRHNKELTCAKKVAAHFGVQHSVLDLSAVFAKSDCCLLANSDKAVPHGSYADQQNEQEGVVKTYVPFRNGLFLSAAASYAMGIFPDSEVEVWIGAHADDAAGNAYPDCSVDFLDHMAKAILRGTDGAVHITYPLADMNKSQVVAEGLKLNAPYRYTWSCYEGGHKPCGKCGTCIDRREAFEANGVNDPASEEE